MSHFLVAFLVGIPVGVVTTSLGIWVGRRQEASRQAFTGRCGAVGPSGMRCVLRMAHAGEHEDEGHPAIAWRDCGYCGTRDWRYHSPLCLNRIGTSS